LIQESGPSDLKIKFFVLKSISLILVIAFSLTSTVAYGDVRSGADWALGQTSPRGWRGDAPLALQTLSKDKPFTLNPSLNANRLFSPIARTQIAAQGKITAGRSELTSNPPDSTTALDSSRSGLRSELRTRRSKSRSKSSNKQTPATAPSFVKRKQILILAFTTVSILFFGGWLVRKLVYDQNKSESYQQIVAIANNPNPANLMTKSEILGAKRVSKEWEGYHLEVVAGAHGASQAAKEISAVAKDVLDDPDDWIFAVEEANQDIARNSELVDLKTMWALYREAGNPPLLDPVPSTGDAEVVRQIAKKLNLTEPEVREAATFDELIFGFGIAEEYGRLPSFGIEFMAKARQLTHGYSRDQYLNLIKSAASKLDSEDAIRKFADVVEHVKQAELEARNQIGRRRFLEALKQYQGRKKIIALIGNNHSAIFDIPVTYVRKDPPRSSADIHYVLENLAAAGIFGRSELRSMWIGAVIEPNRLNDRSALKSARLDGRAVPNLLSRVGSLETVGLQNPSTSSQVKSELRQSGEVQKANILVTGGAGYVGGFVIQRLLERGYQVTVLDNLSAGFSGAVPLGVQLMVADLNDIENLRNIFRSQKFDAVIHLAGNIDVRESKQKPIVYYYQNLLMTIQLLEVMDEFKVKKIVFPSTAMVYDSYNSGSIGENHDIHPSSPYAEAKYLTEKVLGQYWQHKEIQPFILRYFNVAGASHSGKSGEARQPQVRIVSMLLQVALGLIPAFDIISNDAIVRDYVHVKDVAIATELALENLLKQDSKESPQILNVGSGTGSIVRKVIEEIRQVTGIAIPTHMKEGILAGPSQFVANIDKIRRVLGWQPENSTLHTIVETAWQWHKQYPHGYGEQNLIYEPKTDSQMIHEMVTEVSENSVLPQYLREEIFAHLSRYYPDLFPPASTLKSELRIFVRTELEKVIKKAGFEKANYMIEGFEGSANNPTTIMVKLRFVTQRNALSPEEKADFLRQAEAIGQQFETRTKSEAPEYQYRYSVHPDLTKEETPGGNVFWEASLQFSRSESSAQSELRAQMPGEFQISLKDTSSKTANRLKESLLREARKFANGDSADLRESIKIAKQINPAFQTRLTASEATDPNGDMLAFFSVEVNRQVLIPAGYFYMIYILGDPEPLVYEAEIKRDDWEPVGPYLGEWIWKVPTRFSRLPEGSVSLVLNELVMSDADLTQNDAAAFYDVIQTGQFRQQLILKRLRELLQEAGIGRSAYGKLFGEERNQWEEIRKAETYIYVKQIAKQNGFDPEALPFISRQAQILLHSILKPDSHLSEIFQHHSTIGEDRAHALQFGFLVQFYSVRIAALIDQMESLLAGRQGKEGEDLAYTAFLDFLALEELTFSMQSPQAQRILDSGSAQLFLNRAENVKKSLNSFTAILGFVESGSEHPVRRALQLLKDIYALDFWNDAERENNVKDGLKIPEVRAELRKAGGNRSIRASGLPRIKSGSRDQKQIFYLSLASALLLPALAWEQYHEQQIWRWALFLPRQAIQYLLGVAGFVSLYVYGAKWIRSKSKLAGRILSPPVLIFSFILLVDLGAKTILHAFFPLTYDQTESFIQKMEKQERMVESFTNGWASWLPDYLRRLYFRSHQLTQDVWLTLSGQGRIFVGRVTHTILDRPLSVLMSSAAWQIGYLAAAVIFRRASFFMTVGASMMLAGFISKQIGSYYFGTTIDWFTIAVFKSENKNSAHFQDLADLGLIWGYYLFHFGVAWTLGHFAAHRLKPAFSILRRHAGLSDTSISSASSVTRAELRQEETDISVLRADTKFSIGALEFEVEPSQLMNGEIDFKKVLFGFRGHFDSIADAIRTQSKLPRSFSMDDMNAIVHYVEASDGLPAHGHIVLKKSTPPVSGLVSKTDRLASFNVRLADGQTLKRINGGDQHAQKSEQEMQQTVSEILKAYEMILSIPAEIIKDENKYLFEFAVNLGTLSEDLIIKSAGVVSRLSEDYFVSLLTGEDWGIVNDDVDLVIEDFDETVSWLMDLNKHHQIFLPDLLTVIQHLQMARKHLVEWQKLQAARLELARRSELHAERKFDVVYGPGLSYPVTMARNIFSRGNHELTDLIGRRKTLFIIDRGIGKGQLEAVKDYVRWSNAINKEINAVFLRVPGGETVKMNMKYVRQIIRRARQAGLDRKSVFVIVGGGATLDMGSFAADIFHRGAAHIKIPTTLLSQVDAGISMKNGINSDGRKNLLGTVSAPEAVLVDPTFLYTLRTRVISQGFAEMIKAALMRDGRYFEQIEAYYQELLQRTFSRTMEDLIWRAIEIHLTEINNDPFEQKLERPLAFGHVWAHWLENITNNRLSHGEAVGIGMAIDTQISEQRGLINQETRDRVINLIQRVGLPIYDSAAVTDDYTDVLEEFRQHLGGKLTVGLLNFIGSRVDVDDITKEEIKAAINFLAQRSAASEIEAPSGFELHPDISPEALQEFRNTPVATLGISARARTAMRQIKVETIFDLLKLTEADLLRLPNFGSISLDEIKEQLAARNLLLSQSSRSELRITAERRKTDLIKTIKAKQEEDFPGLLQKLKERFDTVSQFAGETRALAASAERERLAQVLQAERIKSKVSVFLRSLDSQLANLVLIADTETHYRNQYAETSKLPAFRDAVNRLSTDELNDINLRLGMLLNAMRAELTRSWDLMRKIQIKRSFVEKSIETASTNSELRRTQDQPPYFADTLKYFRNVLGLSQAEFAKFLSSKQQLISEASISDWERHRFAVPLDVAARAQALVPAEAGRRLMVLRNLMNMTQKEFGMFLNLDRLVAAKRIKSWEDGNSLVSIDVMNLAVNKVKEESSRRLRSIRNQLGLSLGAFGKLLRPRKPIPISNLSVWERGRRLMPGWVMRKADTLFKEKSGRRLQFMRKKLLNLSHGELSRLLNLKQPISPSAIERMEKGEMQIPTGMFKEIEHLIRVRFSEELTTALFLSDWTTAEFGRFINPEKPVSSSTVNLWTRGVWRVSPKVIFKTRAIVKKESAKRIQTIREFFGFGKRTFGIVADPRNPASGLAVSYWERGFRLPSRERMQEIVAFARIKSGKRLKLLRKRLGRTQVELGRLINPDRPVSQSTLESWENNPKRPVPLRVMARMNVLMKEVAPRAELRNIGDASTRYEPWFMETYRKLLRQMRQTETQILLNQIEKSVRKIEKLTAEFNEANSKRNDYYHRIAAGLSFYIEREHERLGQLHEELGDDETSQAIIRFYSGEDQDKGKTTDEMEGEADLILKRIEERNARFSGRSELRHFNGSEVNINQSQFIPSEIKSDDGEVFQVVYKQDILSQGSNLPDLRFNKLEIIHRGKQAAFVYFGLDQSRGVMDRELLRFIPERIMIKVEDHYRKKYEGIGSSLMSMAFRIAQAAGKETFEAIKARPHTDQFYRSLGMVRLEGRGHSYRFLLKENEMASRNLRFPEIGIHTRSELRTSDDIELTHRKQQVYSDWRILRDGTRIEFAPASGKTLTKYKGWKKSELVYDGLDESGRTLVMIGGKKLGYIIHNNIGEMWFHPLAITKTGFLQNKGTILRIAAGLILDVFFLIHFFPDSKDSTVQMIQKSVIWFGLWIANIVILTLIIRAWMHSMFLKAKSRGNGPESSIDSDDIPPPTFRAELRSLLAGAVFAGVSATAIFGILLGEDILLWLGKSQIPDDFFEEDFVPYNLSVVIVRTLIEKGFVDQARNPTEKVVPELEWPDLGLDDILDEPLPLAAEERILELLFKARGISPRPELRAGVSLKKVKAKIDEAFKVAVKEVQIASQEFEDQKANFESDSKKNRATEIDNLQATISAANKVSAVILKDYKHRFSSHLSGEEVTEGQLQKAREFISQLPEMLERAAKLQVKYAISMQSKRLEYTKGVVEAVKSVLELLKINEEDGKRIIQNYDQPSEILAKIDKAMNAENMVKPDVATENVRERVDPEHVKNFSRSIRDLNPYDSPNLVRVLALAREHFDEFEIERDLKPELKSKTLTRAISTLRKFAGRPNHPATDKLFLKARAELVLNPDGSISLSEPRAELRRLENSKMSINQTQLSPQSTAKRAELRISVTSLNAKFLPEGTTPDQVEVVVAREIKGIPDWTEQDESKVGISFSGSSFDLILKRSEGTDNSAFDFYMVAKKFVDVGTRSKPAPTPSETAAFGTLSTAVLANELFGKLITLIKQGNATEVDLNSFELKEAAADVVGLSLSDLSNTEIGLAISSKTLRDTSSNNLAQALFWIANSLDQKIVMVGDEPFSREVIDLVNAKLSPDKQIDIVRGWSQAEAKLKKAGITQIKAILAPGEHLLNIYKDFEVKYAQNVTELLSIAGVSASITNEVHAQLLVMQAA